jgi:serine phosphatase RsbU (regulator of sigma subunit)
MTHDLAMDPAGKFQMERGDLLAVYTDGLYESRGSDNVVLGQPAILSLLREHRDADLDELIDASCRFCAPHEPSDDTTVALVRCTA